MPKSSTVKQNMTGRHLWSQRPGGGGGFTVPFGTEALAEEVVGTFTGLGYPIDTFADAKLHPTIMCIGGEVVFGYEL